MAKRQRRQEVFYQLPKVPTVRTPAMPRVPRGFGSRDITITTDPLPGANQFREHDPAGDPPLWWQMRYPSGTRPEWAVFWALTKLGHVSGVTFQYQAQMPGMFLSYYSTTDFMVPDLDLAIEVQGQYWHYGQGSDKVFEDRQRWQILAQRGLNLVFIDEGDALRRPIWITKEALSLRDHSKIAQGG